MREFARSVLFPGCDEAFPRDLERRRARTRLAHVKTADGLELTGALCEASAPGAPLAVSFHGNGESAAQNLWMADVLNDAAIDVFLVEYRGYGGMPGRPSEEGFYADAEAALAWLRAEGFARERTVLVGRSIGTGVATEMAKRGYGAKLVLVSPFSSVDALAVKMMGPLVGKLVWDHFDNATKIAALDMPVVVIHGTEDDLIPYAMGEQLAKSAKRGRLVPIERGTHNELPGLPRLLVETISAREPG